MVYCALGFGNNFFYPFGTESLPIPTNLLLNNDDDHDDDNDDDDRNDCNEIAEVIFEGDEGQEEEEEKEKEDDDGGDDSKSQHDSDGDNDGNNGNDDNGDGTGDEITTPPPPSSSETNAKLRSENVDESSSLSSSLHVCLLPFKSCSSSSDSSKSTPTTTATTTTNQIKARDWIRSQLLFTPGNTTSNNNNNNNNNSNNNNTNTSEFASSTLPLASCGATHTSFILPSSHTHHKSASASSAGEAHIVGTIFGTTFPKLSIQPTRLPLRILRIASGRRHVLALTEGAAPLGGGIGGSGGGSGSGGGFGGGVVMSWGAGHFGQLGHGPDVTSCLEPRIVERLLPHVVGGQVIEIAAGGLHSAAIVASSSLKNQKVIPSSTTTTGNNENNNNSSSSSNNNSNKEPTIIIRETRTFAWGSNRKGQCGIDGGKCATVPAPLPVVTVKRVEASSSRGIGAIAGGRGANTKTAQVDKVVHFEKLSLGRVHTVALTAYGEVFSWGSTSMGRCGHSMENGRGISADRRICQEPRFVSALRNVAIEAIAAGDAHTLALSKGGRVFAWGAGSDGQCGQGHAGNLFSPRAVNQLHFLEVPKPIDSSFTEINNKATTTDDKTEDDNDSKGKGDDDDGDDAGNNDDIPRINSKVALAVAMEEEEVSKVLSMAQTVKLPSPGQQKTEPTSKDDSTPSQPPKDVKVVSIRASGCYSAAVTSFGDVYTWGYAGGAAMGHPIPSNNESCLPLMPLIEGNQYSSVTAAKVFPEGGSEENIIRDCRAFDTDMNVMLPRKVDCISKLGLRAEDVSLGPDHMVVLCSMRGGSGGDRIVNEALTGQALYSENEHGQGMLDEKFPYGGIDETTASGSVEGLSSLSDAYSGYGRAVTAVSTSSTPGDVSTVGTYESVDSSEYSKSEKRRGWMTKIRSSRSSKNYSHQNNDPQQDNTVRAEGSSPPCGKEREKKKSFLQVGKMLDVAFHRSGGK